MHQTTVRFGADLWEALEDECQRLSVSVAQYLREAALTRLVYAAGRRGDAEFETALDLVIGTGAETPHPAGELDELESMAGSARSALDVHERASREGSESAALAAQSRLARERARRLREQSARRRRG